MNSPQRPGTSPLVGAALMGAALALAALHRQGVPSAGPSMPLTAFPALQRKGALFSTHRDRPVQGCSWPYWGPPEKSQIHCGAMDVTSFLG
ncbi:MAG: hypothetical protein VKJ66_10710 [Synechococcus sp.]|nr:hypothetical protein [Synechococcus sp.]